MHRLRRTVDDEYGDTGFLSIHTSGSSPQSISPSAAVHSRPGNCILHPVSRFDTLAGVAIRYGVEVADIKRLNGLSSDLQMFALKTLRIPLPGKHPPSTSLSNGHNTPQGQSSDEHNPSKHHSIDLFDSFLSLKPSLSPERKVSPAMSNMQGYYGTRQADKITAPEEFEMDVYPDGSTHHLQNGAIESSSPLSNPTLSHHRKSRSVANSLMSANGSLHDPLLSKQGESGTDTDKWIEKLFKRRQKSESDFASHPSEKHMKEETCGGCTISPITKKGLAMRPKSSNRAVLAADDEPVLTSPTTITLGDSHDNDTSDSVWKSSSISSLMEGDNGAFSLWPTSKWILKPDFQALSSAAIPIFDGLPRAMGMKSKAALD